MKITLCSAFRNSTGYLDRYFAQVEALQQALHKRGDTLAIVWGEGDSVDATPAALRAGNQFGAVIVDSTHGGGDYPDVVTLRERFLQLAHVGNTIWRAIPDDTEAVLYVESDIIWNAPTMVALLDQLEHYPAVSPMVMLRRTGYPSNTFYDIFVYRKDGVQFGQYPPYHACYNSQQPFPIDSAGSAMAIRSTFAKRLIWDEDVFMGVCKQIYQMGGSVWVDPRLSITHL